MADRERFAPSNWEMGFYGPEKAQKVFLDRKWREQDAAAQAEDNEVMKADQEKYAQVQSAFSYLQNELLADPTLAQSDTHMTKMRNAAEAAEMLGAQLINNRMTMFANRLQQFGSNPVARERYEAAMGALTNQLEAVGQQVNNLRNRELVQAQTEEAEARTGLRQQEARVAGVQAGLAEEFGREEAQLGLEGQRADIARSRAQTALAQTQAAEVREQSEKDETLFRIEKLTQVNNLVQGLRAQGMADDEIDAALAKQGIRTRVSDVTGMLGGLDQETKQAITANRQAIEGLDPEKHKEQIAFLEQTNKKLQDSYADRLAAKISAEKTQKQYGSLVGMISSLGELLTDIDKQILGEKGVEALEAGAQAFQESGARVGRRLGIRD